MTTYANLKDAMYAPANKEHADTIRSVVDACLNRAGSDENQSSGDPTESLVNTVLEEHIAAAETEAQRAVLVSLRK
jgi:hypothetical protein